MVDIWIPSLHTLSKLYDVPVGFVTPPILWLNIAYFAVAEGWLLLDIGWFVLFFYGGNISTIVTFLTLLHLEKGQWHHSISAQIYFYLLRKHFNNSFDRLSVYRGIFKLAIQTDSTTNSFQYKQNTNTWNQFWIRNFQIDYSIIP